MTFDDVHALAMSLPGVTVTTKWGNRTWVVGDRSFAWQRPFSLIALKTARVRDVRGAVLDAHAAVASSLPRARPARRPRRPRGR